jgi:hypothetical protein
MQKTVGGIFHHVEIRSDTDSPLIDLTVAGWVWLPEAICRWVLGLTTLKALFMGFCACMLLRAYIFPT